MLEDLKKHKEELSKLEKQKQESYAFWSIWKHYAQNEPYFNGFIHKYEIPWEELKYHHKDEEGSIATGDFVTLQHGEKLWFTRYAILKNIEKTEQRIDELLEALHCKNEVPLAAIGPYYGASPSGVFNYMTSRPWFIRRKDKTK